MSTLRERCLKALTGTGWQTPTDVAAAIGHARHPVDAQLRRAWQEGLLDRRPGDDGRKVEYRVKRVLAPASGVVVGKPYARGFRWGGEA